MLTNAIFLFEVIVYKYTSAQTVSQTVDLVLCAERTNSAFRHWFKDRQSL